MTFRLLGDNGELLEAAGRITKGSPTLLSVLRLSCENGALDGLWLRRGRDAG